MNKFLPINRKDMEDRGWEQCDFVLVSGDAYVDHPSFGVAIISRTLEAAGYKVCVLAQPNYRDTKDFMQFGKPRLGFMVTAGNIDSMVNHYSVSKKKRHKDYYSPGGVMGKRPDRATIVYSQVIRQAYPDTYIVLGGIEASLRRLAHYDYWDNKVRKSILVDANADVLIYGMAENSVIDVANALNNNEYVYNFDGIVYKTKNISNIDKYIMLPSYTDICNDKKIYAQSFNIQYANTDHFNGSILIEPYKGYYIVQNRANRPLTTEEYDYTYSLDYQRNYHPIYESMGGIPAIEEVKYSLISNRGCFGSCNFCALTFHQGRIMQSRSHDSLIEEATKITRDKNFKGYIHDVGGPTANFRHPACSKQLTHGACKNKECLWPKACNNLNVDHNDYLSLLNKLKKIPNVKKVFVRSGIRYDYLMYDKDESFFNALVKDHISGQLKVAPEHVSNKVLDKMGKPRRGLYDEFVEKYYRLNKKHNKNQYLVPYLMSSHPGSDISAAIELAEYLRDIKHQPEQVQDFYPTPATLSTAMYYTGLDPRDMTPVYVAKTSQEKAMQRALIQYRNPKNYDLVFQALNLADRKDLIGYTDKCLIRPINKPNSNYKKYKKFDHNKKK